MSKNMHRVIVDAGHGGVDPGAPIQGGRFQEKDIALQVALKVGSALRDSAVDVVYTRTTDTLIARADRGRIANQADGDVFISITSRGNPHWRDPGPRAVRDLFLVWRNRGCAARGGDGRASVRFEAMDPRRERRARLHLNA